MAQRGLSATAGATKILGPTECGGDLRMVWMTLVDVFPGEELRYHYGGVIDPAWHSGQQLNPTRPVERFPAFPLQRSIFDLPLPSTPRIFFAMWPLRIRLSMRDAASRLAWRPTAVGAVSCASA